MGQPMLAPSEQETVGGVCVSGLLSRIPSRHEGRAHTQKGGGTMNKAEQEWKAVRAYWAGKPRPKGVSRKVWKKAPEKARPKEAHHD